MVCITVRDAFSCVSICCFSFLKSTLGYVRVNNLVHWLSFGLVWKRFFGGGWGGGGGRESWDLIESVSEGFPTYSC